MFGTFWALVPPIIAIGLALITKEVYSSLFIGAVAGALFYAGFHVEALDSLLNDGVVAAIRDNAGIFMFLVLLGILVALLNKAGGSAAFGAWAKTHIRPAAAPCSLPSCWVCSSSWMTTSTASPSAASCAR